MQCNWWCLFFCNHILVTFFICLNMLGTWYCNFFQISTFNGGTYLKTWIIPSVCIRIDDAFVFSYLQGVIECPISMYYFWKCREDWCCNARGYVPCICTYCFFFINYMFNSIMKDVMYSHKFEIDFTSINVFWSYVIF